MAVLISLSNILDLGIGKNSIGVYLQFSSQPPTSVVDKMGVFPHLCHNEIKYPNNMWKNEYDKS